MPVLATPMVIEKCDRHDAYTFWLCTMSYYIWHLIARILSPQENFSCLSVVGFQEAELKPGIWQLLAAEAKKLPSCHLFDLILLLESNGDITEW